VPAVWYKERLEAVPRDYGPGYDFTREDIDVSDSVTVIYTIN